MGSPAQTCCGCESFGDLFPHPVLAITAVSGACGTRDFCFFDTAGPPLGPDRKPSVPEQDWTRSSLLDLVHLVPD